MNLETFPEVERALRTYADAYQPRTSSITTVPQGRAGADRFPFADALLDHLDERHELRVRMAWLDAEARVVIARWYIEGARPEVIARGLRRSVRHVYRVRARAMEQLAAMGCNEEFADADVAEFA